MQHDLKKNIIDLVEESILSQCIKFYVLNEKKWKKNRKKNHFNLCTNQSTADQSNLLNNLL